MWIGLASFDDEINGDTNAHKQANYKHGQKDDTNCSHASAVVVVVWVVFVGGAVDGIEVSCVSACDTVRVRCLVRAITCLAV